MMIIKFFKSVFDNIKSLFHIMLTLTKTLKKLIPLVLHEDIGARCAGIFALKNCQFVIGDFIFILQSYTPFFRHIDYFFEVFLLKCKVHFILFHSIFIYHFFSLRCRCIKFIFSVHFDVKSVFIIKLGLFLPWRFLELSFNFLKMSLYPFSRFFINFVINI